jgi:CheY-like chemotaxis protein/HPt (histidine-containing phosphotransfer) domain-containing protein
MMSREVIALLASEAGFLVETCESGEEALKVLQALAAPPHAMLVDMQMPGLSGDALAHELRSACGPATRLILISGNAVEPARRRNFDHFLLKPFSSEQLQQALISDSAAGAHDATVPAEQLPGLDPRMISEPTFLALRQSMPAAQLSALYTMCLDDVDARLATVCKASEDRDADAFRRAAHSIKGGCGMVGATELARLASDFEQNGMPVVHTLVPFNDFLQASARLRGMLKRVLNDI